MFLSDTAINPNPTSDDMAKIALMTAKTVRMFGMEPVIAMVSFSNFGSSLDPSAGKVREAVAYLHKYYPDLAVDGEIKPILRSIQICSKPNSHSLNLRERKSIR
jgi:malate dehydrogenase (oxaloacetate-decarboxylating)(NADP+)